jgi:hypothetical protein
MPMSKAEEALPEGRGVRVRTMLARQAVIHPAASARFVHADRRASAPFSSRFLRIKAPHDTIRWFFVWLLVLLCSFGVVAHAPVPMIRRVTASVTGNCTDCLKPRMRPYRRVGSGDQRQRGRRRDGGVGSACALVDDGDAGRGAWPLRKNLCYFSRHQ